MKHSSRIKSISNKTIELDDGSRWDVTDISAAVRLPMWMVMDKVVGDDFGINAHLNNERRGETLKATLLR